MTFPVLLSADVVVEDAAPEAAEYAARALLTDSFSVNWCAEDAIALVDSFHSLEALNSDCRVSVNTCHGDLFPCGGGGGGGASFFFLGLPVHPFPPARLFDRRLILICFLLGLRSLDLSPWYLVDQLISHPLLHPIPLRFLPAVVPEISK